ncbi:MAG: TatD family hydrolase [Dehalococcoidia bacterium]
MQGAVDTHAHLDEIEDIDSALERAVQAGVGAVIAVGQDLVSNQKIIALSARYPGLVYAAVGLHPWTLGSMDKARIEENIAFVKTNLPSACALGEVGLDYDKRVLKGAGKDLQQNVLRRLLMLAIEYDKPVSLHSRYAWKDCLQLAKETGVKRLVFHWYTGFSSTLSELIEAGYYISATPAAEYHDEHRRAIREAPPDRLLLETDCPVYYGRGDDRYRSQPADALRSLKAAAQIKGIDEGELSLKTTSNAIELFKLTG